MRTFRMAIALAGATAALVIGAGAPASAGTPLSHPDTVTSTSASGPYQFGVYYTLDACQYFGNSLVSGGAWGSYNCVYQWNSGAQQGYWYLYMW